MIRLGILSFLFPLILQAQAHENLRTVFQVNDQDTLSSVAGELTKLSLKFFNTETGMPVHHFMDMHAKPMHMIVVHESLEHFAHVHPKLNHRKMRFEIELNAETAPDPDNFHVVDAMPSTGNYMIFTESMPHMEPMLMAYTRHELSAQASEDNRELPTVRLLENVRYFDEIGKVSSHGAAYKATFSYEQFQWCSWWLPKFYVVVEAWDSETRSYKPTVEFQDWLTMGGHAVVINRNLPLEERAFYHLHAFKPIAQPGKFVLPYHDHSRAMADGDYRLWFQFKTNDRVFTVPFDFIYENPPLEVPPGLGSLLLPCL